MGAGRGAGVLPRPSTATESAGNGPDPALNEPDHGGNMSDEVKVAMQLLAKKLRTAAIWCTDGYYASDSERTVNAAKREAWEKIAACIDSAFDVDSTISFDEQRNMRRGYFGG